MKRIVLLLMVLCTVSLTALDFSVQPKGFVFFPLGKSAERYTIGGGGDIQLGLDLSSLWPNPLGLGYGVGVEGGFIVSGLAGGSDERMQYLSGGLGPYLFMYPLSRLFTRLDTTLGIYRGSALEYDTVGFWWRTGGEAGFRFTPNFTLSLDLGFRQYHQQGGTILSRGLSTGLAFHITFETGNSSRSVDTRLEQEEPVFPIYLSLYQKSPAAMLNIKNSENAEIRNVRVSYRAGNYTASEFASEGIAFIARGREAELPLYVDFSPDILNITEDGRITGEVVIRYTMLGKEREAIKSAAIQVYNRNSYQQGDPAGLASFVSPTSAEVLEYTKAITGLARSNRKSGLNANMQDGFYLFEGLRASSIVIRNSTAGNEQGLTEVQFPAQTLAYRSGTLTDLGLLYAGMLEAAGISAALIVWDGGSASPNFIVAVNLGLSESAAEGLFNGTDKLLIINDEAWLPLSLVALDRGAIAAWNAASEALGSAFASGASVDFVMLEDAWGIYPPAPLSALGVRTAQANEGRTVEAANAAVSAYINSELAPKVAELNGQIQRSSGSEQAALYNRLGMLHVRMGRNPDAKTAFERGAGLGSVPAMANRGNIAFLEKEYAVAERWFRQALAARPGYEMAERGLQQVESAR